MSRSKQHMTIRRSPQAVIREIGGVLQPPEDGEGVREVLREEGEEGGGGEGGVEDMDSLRFFGDCHFDPLGMFWERESCGRTVFLGAVLVGGGVMGGVCCCCCRDVGVVFFFSSS